MKKILCLFICFILKNNNLIAQEPCNLIDSTLKDVNYLNELLNNSKKEYRSFEIGLKNLLLKRVTGGFFGIEYTSEESFIATLLDINYTYQCDSVIPILKLYRDFILSDIQTFEYYRLKDSGANVDSLYETKISVENVKVEINDPIIDKMNVKLIKQLYKKGYKIADIASKLNKREDEINKIIEKK